MNFAGAENGPFLTACNILCSFVNVQDLRLPYVVSIDFGQYKVEVKTFRAVGRTISGDQAYTAFP